MTWSADSVIDIIFVPLYAVLLIANIFNCVKYGITRDAGYLFLLVASTIKIAGSILTVLYNTGAETSTDVDIWGQILIQLGIFPVLSASLAFIRKWIRKWESEDPRLTAYLRPMRLLHLIILGGLICNIIGGTDMASSDNVDEGFTLRRVGDFFFIAAILLIFLSTLFLSITSSSKAQRHDPQLTQVFWVLPISTVRIIYSTAQAFISTPSNPGHNTWVYLCLLLVPDLISVAIYTWFGLRLPAQGVKEMPMQGYGDTRNGNGQPAGSKLMDLGAIPKAYIHGGNMEAAQFGYGQQEGGYHYARQ